MSNSLCFPEGYYKYMDCFLKFSTSHVKWYNFEAEIENFGYLSCNSVSLMVRPPLDVSAWNLAITSGLSEKTYSASGFSRSFMRMIASSTDPTVRIGRIGPKISS